MMMVMMMMMVINMMVIYDDNDDDDDDDDNVQVVTFAIYAYFSLSLIAEQVSSNILTILPTFSHDVQFLSISHGVQILSILVNKYGDRVNHSDQFHQNM